MNQSSPIGFFDSGLGGISVLRETRKLLPGEDYVYYGDSRNAPYGVRDPEQVLGLTREAADHLLQWGAKAIVLACNTATSAAVQLLREQLPQIPIIGTEPALKPAVEHHPDGRILVMATAGTLKGAKFNDNYEQHRSQAEIIPVPCSGLMEFVERGEFEGERLEQFLMEKLEPYCKVPVDAVVLGCTHYPFLRPVIRKIVGRQPEILDGSDGVARQLRRQLEQRNLLNPRQQGGTVRFYNSSGDPEMEARCRMLLDYEEETHHTAGSAR